jgi:putative endonuclease
MAHFVYILECSDKTLYTGYTNNLEKRIQAHNTSKAGARYTKSRRPVVLRYFEKFKTVGKALQREYNVKQLSRIQKMALVKKAPVKRKSKSA